MTCSRIWAVEAVRDGRLAGPEAAVVRRHAETCGECAEEARRLDALGAMLRSLPAAAPDVLSVRREKHRLLAALDEASISPPRARWPLAVAAATVVLASIATVAMISWPRPVPTVRAATSVEAVGDAHWGRERDGLTETIRLDEGRLSLRVQRAEGERVIVRLPDGEIEDRGTTFSVEVAHGHTEHVTVDEGAIELRRAGSPTITLNAGESWRRDAAPVVSAVVASPPALEPPPAPSAAASVTVAEARTTTVARRPRAVTEVPTPPSNLSSGFRALAAGRPDEAATLLGDAQEHARDDGAAEDAAYLRLVAVARTGDRDRTRALAKAYLAKFPRGFRRADVEALAR